jgi:hypothetical protein
MPAHTWEFYKTNMFFAQLDLFDGSGYYEDMFSFKDTDPLNSNWELLMIDEKNFMFNSGSFFIMIIIIVVNTVVKSVYNRIATKYAHVYVFRNTGVLIKSTET